MTKDNPMMANPEEKTGRTMAEWHAVLAGSGAAKHGEMVALLKQRHDVTHGYANLIAHDFRNRDATADDADLVTAQYADRTGLRGIYDEIVSVVESFGDDVEVAPKKRYVRLRRSVQFALVQPSTRSRVDLGIKLKGASPEGRLELSGSWNQMVTHRVRLEDVDDVDQEVVDWLRRAYEAA